MLLKLFFKLGDREIGDIQLHSKIILYLFIYNWNVFSLGMQG